MDAKVEKKAIEENSRLSFLSAGLRFWRFAGFNRYEGPISLLDKHFYMMCLTGILPGALCFQGYVFGNHHHGGAEIPAQLCHIVAGIGSYPENIGRKRCG